MWLAGFLLAVLAGLGVAWPWLTRPPRAILSNRRANITAFNTRLAELEAEAAAGVLPADALERSRGELAARAAAEASPETAVPLETGARPWAVGVTAAVLLAFAGAWYGYAGSWRVQKLVELAAIDPEAARKASLDDMVRQLQKQVASHPNDGDAWLWLGRGLTRLGRFDEAQQAYDKAGAIKGRDPDLMVEQAAALAHTDPSGAAAKFDAVLAIVPDEQRALWYAGALAMQRGDSKTALARWQRLLQQDLPDSIRQAVEHGVTQLGGQVPAAKARTASSPVELQIEVSLAANLKEQVKPGDALFVFAQAVGGPPMPLAVQRLGAAEFPASVKLDDSNSPMPTRKLSSVDRWRVVARVSKSGSAQPQPGDLQGELEVARRDAGQPVKVRIDHVVP